MKNEAPKVEDWIEVMHNIYVMEKLFYLNDMFNLQKRQFGEIGERKEGKGKRKKMFIMYQLDVEYILAVQ